MRQFRRAVADGCYPAAGYAADTLADMERPLRFEHSRFVGDKRTQLVYDLDDWEDAAVVNEFVDLGTGVSFGPDTLAEARNRGYSLARPGQHRVHRKPRA